MKNIIKKIKNMFNLKLENVMQEIKLSIIIPCFNEEKTIPIFYKEIMKVIKQLDCNYELIFINDGSTDETLNKIKNLSYINQNVKYISFSRNFGKEAAMYAGFCNVHGEYISIMDVDMQDPPSLLIDMIELLNNDKYDCIATRRKTRKGEPIIRSWFARKFYKIINKLTDIEIIDGARDFRLMKQEMVDCIISMSENNRFSKGIFSWIGFNTYWISYDNKERVAGETKWSFWKLMKYAIDGITNFSQIPLTIIFFLSILFSCFSVFSIVYILLSSNILIMKQLLIILGINILELLAIGTISQYISIINTEVKKRPHYIVKESNIDMIKKIN
mgnify:CR=1 FL=1